ncbi:hypothetical protein [Nostoc sp.]
MHKQLYGDDISSSLTAIASFCRYVSLKKKVLSQYGSVKKICRFG